MQHVCEKLVHLPIWHLETKYPVEVFVNIQSCLL